MRKCGKNYEKELSGKRDYKEVKEEVGGNKGKAVIKISLNLQ